MPRQEVEVLIVTPSAPIARRLDLGPDDSVVVRRRLRLANDIPVQTADSYYPRWVADGTAIMTPGDVTIPGGLMAAAGQRQVRFRDEMIARQPSQEETERLKLLAATPVTEHIRTGYNTDNRPVRVIITILPGDRNRTIYEGSME